MKIYGNMIYTYDTHIYRYIDIEKSMIRRNYDCTAYSNSGEGRLIAYYKLKLLKR